MITIAISKGIAVPLELNDVLLVSMFLMSLEIWYLEFFLKKGVFLIVFIFLL